MTVNTLATIITWGREWCGWSEWIPISYKWIMHDDVNIVVFYTEH